MMTTYNFPPTSRYYGVETTTLTAANGRSVVYLRRRFVPSPNRFALLRLHVVTKDERLDNITAKYMDDPQAFWRIADANAAMRPEELTETPGRSLRITLPEGIPGLTNA
jgi:hypothetical protein